MLVVGAARSFSISWLFVDSCGDDGWGFGIYALFYYHIHMLSVFVGLMASCVLYVDGILEAITASRVR